MVKIDAVVGGGRENCMGGPDCQSRMRAGREKDVEPENAG